MGSISSRPVTDALDDIARNLKLESRTNPYMEGMSSHNHSLATNDSGCHLDDPRSPSCGISRTPIQPGQKLKVLREKAENVWTMLDPRSPGIPGIPRTPIYYAHDEGEEEEGQEEEINTDLLMDPSLFDSAPMFPTPTDTSTPLKALLEDGPHNRSLERSLSDSNLSLDAHDENLLIKSDASPITQTRAVTKIRRSVKRAKNFVRYKNDESSPSTPKMTTTPKTTRLGGLKVVDMNSPRALVQKKQVLKIDGLKRRHSVSSPYKIETQDKENMPYS